MKVGSIPNLINNLKGSGLLSSDPIGIDRIHDGKAAALAQLPYDLKRIVKVAINGDDFCAAGESLQQFAARNFSARQNHYTRNSRPRRISSRRSRSISSRSADESACTALHRFRDGHGHAAVLE